MDGEYACQQVSVEDVSGRVWFDSTDLVEMSSTAYQEEGRNDRLNAIYTDRVKPLDVQLSFVGFVARLKLRRERRPN